MNNTNSISSFKVIALTIALAGTLSAQAKIIAHWTFDQTSGNTVVDSAGTYNGALSPTGSSIVFGGRSGNALSLDRAANGYVTMGNVLGLTSGDYSIVVWMKMNPGDRTQDCILIGKHAAFSRNGYFIHVNQSTGLAMQSQDRAFFYQGGFGVGQLQASETPVCTTTVNDGNWHQIVAVFRAGATKSIYVDGAPAEDSKPSQPGVGNNTPFFIGAVSVNGVPEGRITALVDEVEIYDHALSSADVDYLFQNPAGIALDCEQTVQALQAELADANATIATLQSQLAASNTQVQALEQEITGVDDAFAHLTQHLQSLFRNPRFEIPGASTSAKATSLVLGIEAENKGAKQLLYDNLRR